jgi:DNA-binding SARP family transcriptional activator
MVETARHQPRDGAMMRLYLLGRLGLTGIDAAGALRVLAGDLRTALLSVLALALPGAVRRDTLLGLFWPEAGEGEARHRLRQVLYVLRSCLGEETIVSAGSEQVGLNAQRVWCDAVAFEGALRLGEDAQALELYGGPLCEGLFVSGCPGYERWLSDRRERMAEQAVQAAWRRSAAAETAGDLRAACRYGAQALLQWPDEARLYALLELFERAGDRVGALRLMQRFERDLREQYDLEPSPALQALIARIVTHPAGMPAR